MSHEVRPFDLKPRYTIRPLTLAIWKVLYPDFTGMFGL